MIRLLIASPFVLIPVFLGSLYGAYGQVDPCRALAVERTRVAQNTGSTEMGASLEAWTRLQTSQMSTGACFSGLLDSWGGRFSRSL